MGEPPVEDAVEAEVVEAASTNDRTGYCRNCGNQVLPQAYVCLKCGVPPNVGNSFCWNCGNETDSRAVICVRCGVALQSTTTSTPLASGGRRVHPKNPPMEPGIACLLSILIVGLGQIILGQTMKGVVMLLAAFVLGAATLGAVWVVTVPVSAADAYQIARKLKEGKSVGEWEFF